MDVDAFVFDIGGTVFDWSTALAEALDRCGVSSTGEAAAFALSCRAAFLDGISRVVKGQEPWATSDEVLRAAVSQASAETGLSLDAGQIERVALAWRDMPAWQGAREAIAALRRRAQVAPLTILSWPMAVGSSRRNGIVWDGLLCCDVIGVYKPDPRSYARAAEIMRVGPARIAMVASHPSDLRAARSAGWKTVFVRPHIEDPGEDYADPGLAEEFDVAVADFPALGERLGN
jgi:2-haloacid dehalogenase